MNESRRKFICHTGAILGATAFASGVERFSLVNALAAPAAPTDYRALVCVFMDGGNDGNNMIVPLDPPAYATYSTARLASGLALTQAELQPMTITPPSINKPFALHPALTRLRGLWGQGKVGVVCNVGPLVYPMTRTQYRNNTVPKPYQLFSHSDQVEQSQTAIANIRSQTGWGGRLAERLDSLNGNSSFPLIVTVAGSNVFGQGQFSKALGISAAPTPLTQVLVLNGFGTSAEEVARKTSMAYLRTIDLSSLMIKATSEATQQAVDISQAFSTDPTLTTVFPTTSLGNQLKQVAKLIKLNQTQAALGLERQMFFCRIGGFDTHQDQPANQLSLFQQLDEAMKAFYDATVELSVESRVTTFTLSDFSRTLQPAGTGASVGTDHAWGNHNFVMGGAVRAADFYGVPGSNGTVFPTLAFSGPDDTDSRGRWIPTASVEQYANTLATWYGLELADRPLVFPLLGHFNSADLGFLT
jgi:uncharacterized protein (DUF1501 family)